MSGSSRPCSNSCSIACLAARTVSGECTRRACHTRASLRPLTAMPSPARTLLFTSALLMLGCAPPNAAKPYPKAEPPEGEASEPPAALSPTAVRFLEREIELAPFLEGFPYTDFMPSLEHGRIYYIEVG